MDCKERDSVPEKKTGLIVVITGRGKGKTTAALGMAVRAAGHKMKVCVIQFVKGDMYAGEWDGLKSLEPFVELHTTGKGFCGMKGDRHGKDEHREGAQSGIALALEKIRSGKYDIIILDEINIAQKLGLVDLEQVLGLLDSRPEWMHIVLTGRDAHPEIIKRGHTVTEMVEIKHAHGRRIEPQKGIDY